MICNNVCFKKYKISFYKLLRKESNGRSESTIFDDHSLGDMHNDFTLEVIHTDNNHTQNLNIEEGAQIQFSKIILKQPVNLILVFPKIISS